MKTKEGDVRRIVTAKVFGPGRNMACLPELRVRGHVFRRTSKNHKPRLVRTWPSFAAWQVSGQFRHTFSEAHLRTALLYGPICQHVNPQHTLSLALDELSRERGA